MEHIVAKEDGEEGNGTNSEEGVNMEFAQEGVQEYRSTGVWTQWSPRKKTSLGESLAESHSYNPIRDSGETLDEHEKSRQKSHRESRRESRLDSW